MLFHFLFLADYIALLFLLLLVLFSLHFASWRWEVYILFKKMLPTY